MPAARFVRRMLGRGSGGANDGSLDIPAPAAGAAPPAAGAAASSVYEAPADFTDASSLDSGGKEPIGEAVAFGEKEAVRAAVSQGTALEEEAQQGDQGAAEADGVRSPVQPRNAGFLRSFSNVVCIIIGTGCLQIPYAFAKTGWIGIIILFLSAFIGSYTGVLAIRCLYYQGPMGQRLHSFPQIGRAAFGRVGQYVTQFFNYTYTLGATCLYIILSGQFIYDMLSTLGVGVPQKVWMIIVTVVMWIPVALLKEMSEAAIMAIFGLLASIAVILICTVMSVVKPYTVMYPNSPAPDHHAALGAGIPIALSSIVFSFAGTVVYPHVEESMRKPKQWPMVVYAAMGFCAVFYLMIGVSGYWAYGDLVVSPVLDSIPRGAPATVGKILITVHVIIASPILLLSLFLDIEKQWRITAERLGKKREFLVRLVYRTAIVAAVCGVSLAIPYFSDFLGLISSISCVTMYAMVPIICYLKLFGHRIAPWYEKIWMVVVLAISSVACVWGSIDSIKNLIKDVQGSK